MNFITKKNLSFKLIVCVCIFLVLINFCNPQRVYASDDEELGIGGMLIKPICNLLLGIGDAIMDITQNSIMGTDATIRIDNTEETNWGAILLGILAGAAYVALWLIPGTQGIAAAITSGMIKAALAYGAVNIVTAGGVHATVTAISGEVFDDVAVLPTFSIGPEEIFSGRVLLFDANIFNPKDVKVDYNITNAEGDTVTGSGTAGSLDEWNSLKADPQYQATRYYYIEDGEEIVTSVNNSAYELREIIQKWYYIIRNIALVGSMLILLYIGIRMITSSIAEEKAKYKQMLGDWIIALCLIVLMHYIMIFAHNAVESVTKMFNNMISPGKYVAAIYEPSDPLKKAVEELEDANGAEYIDENGNIKWPTNMMGMFRVEAQNRNGSETYVGYVLAYMALVLFTLVFSFTYIKRLLYLLFLTVIAPLVALTYPIDKIHDGKAQAFDMWLKEYIFNLLIQPFHLLLYTIFVTMAFDLASQNVIYALVVIGFMIPAEKFLRTMFGFNKASTPGLFAGAAGAAFTMSAVNSLGKFAKGHGGGGGGSGSGGKNQSKDEKPRIRTEDSGHTHSQEALYEDIASDAERQEIDRLREEADQGNLNQDQLDELQRREQAQQEREERLRQQREQEEEQERQRQQQEEWTIRGKLSQTKVGEWTRNTRDRVGDAYRNTRDRVANSDLVTGARNGWNGLANSKVGQGIGKAGHAIATYKPIKTAGRFLRATGKSAGQAIKTQAISDLKAAPRTIAKFGASAAAATTLGAIGLTSGIVSGDLNTVVKNTAAGAGVGAAVGTGVVNRVANTVTGNYDKTAKDRFEREYYGADYDRVMKEKADEEFRKDKEIRKLYQDKLGLKTKQEIDTAMNQAVEYRKYGINDDGIIIKAMKVDGGNEQNRIDKRRIAAAKLAENSRNQKDFETTMKRFAKAPGMKKEQVEQMEDMVRRINNL